MNHLVMLQNRANKLYGECHSPEQFIRSVQDFLDLLTWGTEHGTDLYLLRDTNFSPEFYDLSTGLAGEILQKVSNYRQRLAIVGSFEMVTSKRFQEFMVESNRGTAVCFQREKAEAMEWLLS